jgi:hypothetical protein
MCSHSPVRLLVFFPISLYIKDEVRKWLCDIQSQQLEVTRGPSVLNAGPLPSFLDLLLSELSGSSSFGNFECDPILKAPASHFHLKDGMPVPNSFARAPIERPCGGSSPELFTPTLP